MKVLVSNVGSSSYKFQLLDMDTETVLGRGGVERIGNPPSRYAYRGRVGSETRPYECAGEMNAPNHLAAIEHALNFLLSKRCPEPVEGENDSPILESLADLNAVGFKAVFAKGVTSSAVVDDSVVEALEAYIPVMPVHNPAYLASIRAFQRLAPNAPCVAVFETWFHGTIPPYAAEFGVPRSWVKTHGIRRYGFHGASHRYIAQRTPELLKELGLNRVADDELKMISCHLGGSSSVCAIRGGQSIDTSMGFSAQSGLLQGTRCGDLDPFVPLYMMEAGGLSLAEVQRALMKDSGLAGISGVGSDMRDILAAATNGNADAQLALDTFHYGVRKYIGAYAAALGGVDVLVFTGGIGEKGPENRAAVCDGLQFLGIRLNPKKNASTRSEGNIAPAQSRVPVLVVPTNEEIIVARETARLVRLASSASGESL